MGSVLQIRIIFPDPNSFLSASGSAAKLTGRGKLTTYACCLAPGGPTDEENQAKMYKK
jgi:hypothetical protein